MYVLMPSFPELGTRRRPAFRDNMVISGLTYIFVLFSEQEAAATVLSEGKLFNIFVFYVIIQVPINVEKEVSRRR